MKDRIFRRGWLKVQRDILGSFLPQDRNYQKFLLLSRGRMGSNFLLTLLNNHPELVCYFEPFRKKFKEKRRLAIEQDGKHYLEYNFFKPFPKYINAVGIKMFYTHGRYPQLDESNTGITSYGPVWDYFVERLSIKVIQLTRANLLRVYLSEQKAKQSGDWHNFRGSNKFKNNIGPIELDYEHCRKAFQHIKQREMEFSELFRGHEKLDIQYDQLTTNRQETLREIQRFLGVTELHLTTPLMKQNSDSLADNITNYEELKAKFKGSEWEHFFEE
jgi:uncharacterized protein YdcH (DUF465 family)